MKPQQQQASGPTSDEIKNIRAFCNAKKEIEGLTRERRAKLEDLKREKAELDKRLTFLFQKHGVTNDNPIHFTPEFRHLLLRVLKLKNRDYDEQKIYGLKKIERERVQKICKENILSGIDKVVNFFDQNPTLFYDRDAKEVDYEKIKQRIIEEIRNECLARSSQFFFFCHNDDSGGGGQKKTTKKRKRRDGDGKAGADPEAFLTRKYHHGSASSSSSNEQHAATAASAGSSNKAAHEIIFGTYIDYLTVVNKIVEINSTFAPVLKKWNDTKAQSHDVVYRYLEKTENQQQKLKMPAASASSSASSSSAAAPAYSNMLLQNKQSTYTQRGSLNMKVVKAFFAPGGEDAASAQRNRAMFNRYYNRYVAAQSPETAGNEKEKGDFLYQLKLSLMKDLMARSDEHIEQNTKVKTRKQIKINYLS